MITTIYAMQKNLTIPLAKIQTEDEYTRKKAIDMRNKLYVAAPRLTHIKVASSHTESVTPNNLIEGPDGGTYIWRINGNTGKLYKKYFNQIKTLIVMLVLMLSLPAFSQNVKRDSLGNYISVTPAKKPDIPTKYTYTDSKGLVYRVYQTYEGKRYVVKMSKKTGKTYKMYLKEN